MTTIREAQKNWDTLGKTDPLFVILSYKEKEGGKWNEREFFETGRKEIDAALAHAKTHIPELGRERALDFGCAAGRLSLGLARHFAQVDGVDIAPSMIELARKYNTEVDRVRYFVNDKPDLSLFENDRFDFIYTNITLQHIPPEFSKAYLREFVRVLKPGGLLMFQLPTHKKSVPIGKEKNSFKTFLKKIVPESLVRLYKKWRYEERAHVDMYGKSETEVHEIIESAGGKIVDVTPDDIAMGWEGNLYCVLKS